MLLPTIRIVGTSNLNFISFPGLFIQHGVLFKSVLEMWATFQRNV
jgi:hypothetical protein